MEQTDNCQKEVGRRIRAERRARGMDNDVGIDCGNRSRLGGGGQMGKIGTTVIG